MTRPAAPEPPCEQLLVGVVAGGVSSFHPSSTPRAVAQGAGGGWCVAWVVLGPPGCGVVVGSSWWVLGLPLVVVGPWCPFLVVISARRHSLTLPNLQAGACSGGHGWWSAFSVRGGFVRVSVTWRAYGGCWVLTGRVSPFWGLPASLCAFLARVDSLTSHLNGEEGDWVAVRVRCAFFVVARRHQ